MEELKSWALLPLFVSAGCLICYYLLPASSVSKTARAVIAVVMLSAICLPLFSVAEKLGNTEFSFDSEEPDTMAPFAFYEKAAERTAEKTASDIIKKYTAVPFVCSADADCTEDGTVELLRIVIVFDARPEGEKEMRAELLRETGLVPEIRVK